MKLTRQKKRCSKTIFKSESEVKRYIDILSRYFYFKVHDLTENNDYEVNNDLLFNAIDIQLTREIE